MDEGTLAELRAWAATTADAPGVAERDTVACRVREFVDGDSDDPSARAEFVAWAERTARRAPTAEMRSAARVALALVRDRTPPRALHAVDPPLTLGVSRRTMLVAAAAVLAVAAGGVEAGRALTTPALRIAGPHRGAMIGSAQVSRVAFSEVGDPARLRSQRWLLDGQDVTHLVERSGARLVYRPARLDQGLHELLVRQSGGLFGATGRKRFDFAVDLTAPTVHVPLRLETRAWHPLPVRGRVSEAAHVWVAGRAAHVVGNRFTATVESPPATLTIVAIDLAGNRTVDYVPVTISPRSPPVPLRGVHVTADGWANTTLRKGVLALIAQHRINAVELDVKDEGGVIGFGPDIPVALRIGASKPIYDLPAAVAQLHRLGVRVIGRLVCFRDPIAAAAAWHLGERDHVVQTPSGKPYAGYGGFTNVASPAVRRYNIAVAVAAARAGVDDILYDYVRRPDGPISAMTFPGLRGSPSQSVVEFLKESRLALRPYGTYLGASVFGIAATRPDQVAQNVPAMARQLDYIAPMVYPSHWNDGEYDVANPNAEPYQIVLRSLRDFRRDVAGTGARLVPWLQDFSLGLTYGPAQVHQQIRAAEKVGIHEFLLWDPAVTYDAAALTPNAPTSRRDLTSRSGG